MSDYVIIFLSLFTILPSPIGWSQDIWIALKGLSIYNISQWGGKGGSGNSSFG